MAIDTENGIVFNEEDREKYFRWKAKQANSAKPQSQKIKKDGVEIDISQE